MRHSVGAKAPEYPQFAVGNTVRLNSGGPLMTVVVGTNHSGDIECSWFDGHGGFVGGQRFPSLSVFRVIGKEV